jgi:hypothetical protein
MSVEIVGFNGVPVELVCGLHRAVWKDSDGLFELSNDGGKRVAVFGPDFERAIEKGSATAVSCGVERASPWVLVATQSFADSDGVLIPMRSMIDSRIGFYWHAESKRSLREIAASWSAELQYQMSLMWSSASPREAPPFELWIRHVTRLRAAYAVTLNPAEAKQCALYLLALGELINERKNAMRSAVDRLQIASLEMNDRFAASATALARQYGASEKRLAPPRTATHRSGSSYLEKN